MVLALIQTGDRVLSRNDNAPVVGTVQVELRFKCGWRYVSLYMPTRVSFHSSDFVQLPSRKGRNQAS